MRLYKRLSKQSRHRRLETPSRSLWRHSNESIVGTLGCVFVETHSSGVTKCTTGFYMTFSIIINNKPSVDIFARSSSWMIDYMERSMSCPKHDDVIKWKQFPRYWSFVRGIYRSPVNSPHKGQWRGALMFSLICVWINGWVNNREAGDLRRHRAHYDVSVMKSDSECRSGWLPLPSNLQYKKTKSQHLNVSRLGFRLSLPNPLRPGHRWSSDADISRLEHPKMTDAFPGKQLRGRISPCISNIHSPYLDRMTCVWVGMISDNRIWQKRSILCKWGRVINRGGMPVSHHRDFAMMLVAQFRDYLADAPISSLDSC